ncbi:MAG: ABC transporter ATP-binding protein [Acidobacteria bacterium]|nr:ABC transporter ATP-binding protein [Acidobacteriota bacterium]
MQSRPVSFTEYRRVLAYIAPYWRRLAVVLGVSLFSTVLGLTQPYIAKLLIDEALLRRNLRALVFVAGLMVVVTVLGFLLNILSSYRYVKVSAEVLFDMRLALYRRLQALSPRFYGRTRLGEIVSRINNDIGEIQRVSADTVLSLVASLVFLGGSVAIMLWLNWRLFLISAALLPLSASALRHYQRRLAAQVKQVRERSADIGSFLIETLLGMRLVVSSNAEAYEVERFRRRNWGFIDALLAMQLTSYLAGAMPGTILTLSTAAVFLYGGKLVIDGALSVGALVAFMAYHLRLLAPVQNLLGLYTNLATARVSLSRVFELLDAPIEVKERPGAASLREVRGEIVFYGVTLRHDREAPVLDGVSFRVPAGAICAVVGPSGVGKSTIADMILRLYDPDSGAIYLDGRDLRDLRLADLRRAMALVDQEPYLFHAGIAENIAYALPEASRDEVIAAARAAAIHDWIAALPEGYETVVGERGLALSAGERQRIAIARALLRRPAVLVLDEPTAALDPITEASISATLSELLRGRTAIVITHRLSLVEIADSVVILDEGKVAEAGPPMELLARSGPLTRLFGEPSAGRRLLQTEKRA